MLIKSHPGGASSDTDKWHKLLRGSGVGGPLLCSGARVNVLKQEETGPWENWRKKVWLRPREPALDRGISERWGEVLDSGESERI